MVLQVSEPVDVESPDLGSHRYDGVVPLGFAGSSSMNFLESVRIHERQKIRSALSVFDDEQKDALEILFRPLWELEGEELEEYRQWLYKRMGVIIANWQLANEPPNCDRGQASEPVDVAIRTEVAPTSGTNPQDPLRTSDKIGG